MRALALLFAFAAAPLGIVNVSITQIEDGPPIPGGPSFIPGETVFLSFQVEGYQVSSEKVNLSYSIDTLDANGVKVVASRNAVLNTEVSAQDKEWKPKMRTEALVPPWAPSGTYKFAIRVKDELSGASAAREAAFQVRGHQVAPSETLAVRNFQFYRSEEDARPISPPAYRPGDTLWARFDITGYKFGEKNAVDVAYGVAVLSPSGKELFSQPEAAVEQSESFYPKRYVPGMLNLNLQPNIRPGEYTIVVSVADRVGNQAAVEKAVFSVE